MARKDKKKLMGVGLGAGLAGAVFFAIKYALRPASNAPLPDSISPAIFSTKVLHTSMGQLIYHEAGDGEPLLFLHSICLGGSSYEWSKVYPEFASRFRVLAPDLVGFGESQRPNTVFSASDYVRMLAEFIRATCWNDRGPVIVASGLTAGFALQLAAQHPDLVSRLILLMPTGGNDFGSARLRLSTKLAARSALLQRFLYRNYQSTQSAVKHWLAFGGYADAKNLSEEAVEVFTTCAQQSGAEHAIRNFHAGKLNLDLESRIGQISQPLSLLWGSEQAFPGMEQGRWLQSQAQNADLTVLPQVGALAALEDPEVVIAAIKERLEPGIRVVK